MSTKCLVIVESPTKAKTIRKFLPKNYVVEASMGHIRDLPQSSAAIPAKYKDEAWAKLGVNVENNFEPLYVVPKGKSKIITDLKKKMKDADELYLATDEDREGESISWHLTELLKPKIPTKRMIFHEITKSAIQDALSHTRALDEKLVQAQETRRILDRLYGYTLSPLLWKKIAYGLSAGRVQSVGLRLLVERERERRRFKKAIYSSLKALLQKDKKEFEARLLEFQKKKLAIGKDFDAHTGQLKSDGNVFILTEEEAKKLKDDLFTKDWIVKSVEEKDATQKPSPPFITSTLQQEANRKLGLSARDTMRVAQKLYEQGLITYMRTDSPHLSAQAINAARGFVEKLYGKEYLSDEVRQFSAKAKGAQEAHEAIRPAGDSFTHPDEAGLTGKELALYNLIWMRTVASQMAEAKKRYMTVKIEVGDALFSASGTRITFPGFLRAYVEGSDNPDAALVDKEVILPEMKTGDKVNIKTLEVLNHETKPIARYTEASLVQQLEKDGIGRPSTYASIIGTILERNYARKQANALIPTFIGFSVVQILEEHFAHLIDYHFTSHMEEALDEIAEGKREHLPYLKDFYLGSSGLESAVAKKEEKIDAQKSKEIFLEGLKNAQVFVGKYGPYLVSKQGKDEVKATIPEDVAPADLTDEILHEIIETSKQGPQSIGKDPQTGEAIYCLIGRFGPYVQLGEVSDDNPKPRRASIPKEVKISDVTQEQALKWLSLPRTLGTHPETGETIMANNGRFGPYVVHQKDFRSIKAPDDVYTITLKRALEIFSEPKQYRRRKKADA
ncbi:MAG: DNA topoisomerase I [Deltaproteobacteria bacterium CG11_big_fil_rev_8_21_14_0_20_42_23]|nr:MAG: DNA topoisomerase I [Deltaproteobacteria bacterium CG11_big_fil_rev_8_21_14_0_20_42_23]PJC64355.1 MAG: type I DNA topoisomerase [Deltaproteobacteria bacterium CG_4_9_14_0_2_um_filter_42_21]